MKTLVALCSLLLGCLLAPSAQAQPTAATAATLYIDLNGDRIAYRSIGKGRPVLLANRMRGTLDTWDPLFLDQLARDHTVITFDYPGIGYSSGRLPTDMSQVAAFVRDFAAALKLDKFVAGGWSWGGLVMQTLVVEHPGLVTHAVLIGTVPAGKRQMPIQQVFLDRAMNPVNDLADEEILFFEPASARSRQEARLSRERIRVRPDVDARIPSRPEEIVPYLKAAEGFHEDRAGRRERLTRSDTPMLILCGDNDPSTQAQNWFPLVGQMRRGQLIVLPESGHGPQHQYPELSARYIADFVRLSGS